MNKTAYIKIKLKFHICCLNLKVHIQRKKRLAKTTQTSVDSGLGYLQNQIQVEKNLLSATVTNGNCKKKTELYLRY